MVLWCTNSQTQDQCRKFRAHTTQRQCIAIDRTPRTASATQHTALCDSLRCANRLTRLWLELTRWRLIGVQCAQITRRASERDGLTRCQCQRVASHAPPSSLLVFWHWHTNTDQQGALNCLYLRCGCVCDVPSSLFKRRHSVSECRGLSGGTLHTFSHAKIYACIPSPQTRMNVRHCSIVNCGCARRSHSSMSEWCLRFVVYRRWCQCSPERKLSVSRPLTCARLIG